LEWTKFSDSAKTVHQLIDEIVKMSETLLPEMSGQPDHVVQIYNSALLTMMLQKNNIETAILSNNFDDRILWTFKTGEGLTCLKSAPINIGPKLKDTFYDTKKSIILTSATLRIENNFNFICDRINLHENYDEIHFPSHFDFPEQVKIIIPEDMPKPATEGHFKTSAEIIAGTIQKNGGRTLVLFTSKKALTATYLHIAPAMKEKGIEILAQGTTGGKGKILEHFKQEPDKTSIFGLDSFWEGVDIPDNLLTCVIVQKLPFDPPGDPLIFARCRQYEDSFSNYQLPKAILKFKQGFGRLIRSHKDKGTIVILDSRIIQNSYGMQFLNSLPEGIRIDYCTADSIGEKLNHQPANIT